MKPCDVHASGAIDLYFYGELDAAEHASIERHLLLCVDCRIALDELVTIRAALAARLHVSAPPGGDWSRFMRRLDVSVAQEAGLTPHAPYIAQPFRAADQRVAQPFRAARAGYLAMAALLALVTISVLMVARSRTLVHAPAPADQMKPTAAAAPSAEPDPELMSISERHLEKSKLVVLGLTAKDVSHPQDWKYERELAGSLLDDTRLYRLAAEQRGMTHLAGVLRDLEIVLLQTSLTDERDSAALAQIQRLIRKRDLVQQIEAVNTEGS